MTRELGGPAKGPSGTPITAYYGVINRVTGVEERGAVSLPDAIFYAAELNETMLLIGKIGAQKALRLYEHKSVEEEEEDEYDTVH